MLGGNHLTFEGIVASVLKPNFLCGGEWGGKGNDGKGHRLSDQEQQMSDEANQWNGTSSVIWHC